MHFLDDLLDIVELTVKGPWWAKLLIGGLCALAWYAFGGQGQ